ncbi:hypothetical protein FACS1894126_2220 [Alphaproteobacteria bacterium]|nr:hypothetical protein FACS1894126_2220 [Alphaproteobacteria bacterium]
MRTGKRDSKTALPYDIMQPTTENIRLAVDRLMHGDLVAFPTETVYGLGGNAYDDASVAKIFSYKNRPEFNPLSICYGSLEQAAEDVVVTKEALLISQHFLPGPITLLLKRRPNSRLSWLCSAGLETVGIRIPSHPIAQELLARLSFPLAAPSANQSGKISPTSAVLAAQALMASPPADMYAHCNCNVEAESTKVNGSSVTLAAHALMASPPADWYAHCNCSHISVRHPEERIARRRDQVSAMASPTVAEGSEAVIGSNVTLVIDGGQCPIGIESTIVDLGGDNPRILRLGAVAKDEISEKCGLHFDENLHETPAAQLKHYTISKKIVLNCTSADKSDALLAFGTPFPNECSHVLNLSSSGNLSEAAGNLFAMILELDKTNAKRICVMPIPNIGIGIPINDRLNKSAQS